MRIFRILTAVAALVLLGNADLHAQTIGFKLGASFSNVDVEPDDEDTQTLTAFTGGGFINFALGPLQLQPELMYITKGTKIEDVDGEGKWKLSYVEIPVLLVFPLMQGSSFSPYVLGGPAFAFEASCELEFSDGSISGSIDCDEGGDLPRKKFDVGGMFGLGFALPAGPGSVLIEGRYNFGLMDISDSDVENESLKHRSGQVLLGYSIPLTR